MRTWGLALKLELKSNEGKNRNANVFTGTECIGMYQKEKNHDTKKLCPFSPGGK